MASSSKTYGEGNSSSTQTQQQVSAGNNNASSYNNSNGDHQWGVPTFQHQQSISMDWTHDEQAILEDFLLKYASESNIIRYAKIAVQLKNKTVRDVALRCRWMTKKEMNKRRKEDITARKTKDRKEKLTENCSIKPPPPSRLGINNKSGLPYTTLHNATDNSNNTSSSYNNIDNVGGVTRQLLQQNAWAFKQISANLATNKIHENIVLLRQARDNIFKIITNLNEMGPTFKKMPQLPRLNEELAKSILLPPPAFQIRL